MTAAEKRQWRVWLPLKLAAITAGAVLAAWMEGQTWAM